MSHLASFGIAWEESDGRTAISCSTGLKGALASKDLISLSNLSMFLKSEANGA